MRGIDVNASLLRYDFSAFTGHPPFPCTETMHCSRIRFMTRAQYQHATGNFFAVDRLPKHAKWGSENHANELTLDGQRIHVWIVGTVALSRLYDHEHQVDPVIASIEVEPSSRSTLYQAKYFLQNICDGERHNSFLCGIFRHQLSCRLAPQKSIHLRGGKGVICISKSMVHSSSESLIVSATLALYIVH